MRLGKKWKKNFKNKINLKSKKVADKSAQWNKLRQLFFHRMDDHLASRKDRWRHLRVVSGPPDEYIHVRRRPSNCPIKSAKVFTGHWRIWQRSTRTPIFACFFFPFAVMKWWQRHLWWTLCRISRQLPLQAMSTKLMRNFYFILIYLFVKGASLARA